MLISILTFAFFVARDVGNLAGNRFAIGYFSKSAKSEKADLYEEAELGNVIILKLEIFELR